MVEWIGILCRDTARLGVQAPEADVARLRVRTFVGVCQRALEGEEQPLLVRRDRQRLEPAIELSLRRDRGQANRNGCRR